MIAEVGELIQRNYVTVLVLSGLFCLLAGALFANQRSKTVCDEVSYSASSASDETRQLSSELPVGDLTVDLSGAVKNPGVYKLNAESRVVDLMKLGDGFTSDASAQWVSKNLNLSTKLKDSQKVYIPFEWEIEYKTSELLKDGFLNYKEAVDFINQESTPSYSEDTSVQYNSSLINVNSASEAQLDTLAGIGKSYAQKIITNRPYSGFEELKSKSGVPTATLEKIKDSMTF